MIVTWHEGLHKTGIGWCEKFERAQEVFLGVGGGGDDYRRKQRREKGHADGKDRERGEKEKRRENREKRMAGVHVL